MERAGSTLARACPGGEIGRHIGLKIRRFVNNGRAGSIPARGTTYSASTTLNNQKRKTRSAPPTHRTVLRHCGRDQNKKPHQTTGGALFFFGGAARSRTGLNGFAIRRITALLPRHQNRQKREAYVYHRASLFRNLERDKRLELSTYTLARYRSTN